MDWQKATWISGDTSCTAPMFRQDFAVEALETATIIICGLGFFELYLNGARVGDDLFVPVWSNYEKRENRRLLYPLLVSARSKGHVRRVTITSFAGDCHHSFSDVEHQLTKKIDFKVFSSSITDNAVVISTKANDNVPESINTAKKEQWGGIVIEDGAGNVYGESVTITENCTLPDNVELDIGENKTVTISENVTLANNGTIINDGAIINSGTITNNAAIANNGTIDNSGEIFGNAGSSFTGSDPSGGSITYQISWDTDGDGTIDDTTYVSSGATPSHADGSKASTVDTVYTFTGWSPAVASATEPATYTAQFSSDVRSYTVSLPASPEGYTISTDDATSLTYGSSFTFTVNLAEGYSETERFAVRSNGMVLAPNTSGSYSVIVQSDTEITVEGVEDITAPDGDIEIQQNSARKDIDEVSFELFFNQNADITITASDAGSGLKSIEYYRSEEILSAEEVSEITGWVAYTSPITETAADEEKFIYYVKLTDNAGNTACFASNGVTFDLAVPVVSGITDGASYYTTQTVNVTDTSLDSVMVNGTSVTVIEGTAEATLNGNTYTVYTIVAKDKVSVATDFGEQ